MIHHTNLIHQVVPLRQRKGGLPLPRGQFRGITRHSFRGEPRSHSVEFNGRINGVPGEHPT